MILVAAVMALTPASNLTEEELKRYFMQCDKATESGFLGQSDAELCSYVYVEIKNRLFNGDHEQLLKWWRQQKDKK